MSDRSLEALLSTPESIGRQRIVEMDESVRAAELLLGIANQQARSILDAVAPYGIDTASNPSGPDEQLSVVDAQAAADAAALDAVSLRARPAPVDSYSGRVMN